MHQLNASPKSHVAYLREAWMSSLNNALRITFDRQVRCEAEFAARLKTQLGDTVAPFDQKVVLEIKFVDRLPNWCVEMVRAFGLVRGGAPKYAQGVLLMGEQRVSNLGVGLKAAESAKSAKPTVPVADASVAVA